MKKIRQQFAVYEDRKARIPINKNIAKFGIISDTHIGSKYQQISFLKWFYKYIKGRGAKFVLHAGDISDGEFVYPSQQYEVFLQGVSQQAEYIIKNYPSCLPTYFITGNHDTRAFEISGVDIGKIISDNRPDMFYLGQLGAYVYFGGVKAYLVHPLGIQAYAISYKAQKLIEAFSTENKPNLLIIGHFHQAYQLFVRNVYALGGGGFQGQTPYLRRKAVFPIIGGYYIEVLFDKRGIGTFRFEFVPMYKPKLNDY